MNVSRFSVAHPTDPTKTAVYGFDHSIGFFVEFHDENDSNPRYTSGAVLEYDRLQTNYDNERPLQGAISNFIQQGYFSEDDMRLAFNYWSGNRGDLDPEESMRKEAQYRIEFEDSDESPEPTSIIAYNVLNNFKLSSR